MLNRLKHSLSLPGLASYIGTVQAATSCNTLLSGPGFCSKLALCSPILDLPRGSRLLQTEPELRAHLRSYIAGDVMLGVVVLLLATGGAQSLRNAAALPARPGRRLSTCPVQRKHYCSYIAAIAWLTNCARADLRSVSRCVACLQPAAPRRGRRHMCLPVAATEVEDLRSLVPATWVACFT